MRTLVEATAFVSLALVGHLALWMPDEDMGIESSGAGGQSLLSIAAASASVSRMVETWDTSPEAADAVELALSEPVTDPDRPVPVMIETHEVARSERPALDATAAAPPESLPALQRRAPRKMVDAPQMAALAPPSLPSLPDAPPQQAAPSQAPPMALPPALSLPSAPALPSYEPAAPRDRPEAAGKPAQSATAPTTSKRPPKIVPKPAAAPSPKAKPAAKAPAATAQKARPTPEPVAKPAATPAKRPSKPSAGANARVAEGTGGGAAKGNNKKASTATLSQARKTSMLAEWGSQIRARIARRAPSGAGRGTAVVTITVSGNGALLGVRLAKSSGNARIDKLALAAVKQAGRFPAAPKSLGIARHSFRLPIKSK